jgi:hypothetical protein
MPSASLSFSATGNIMQYTTHNNDTIDSNMSSKQGTLSAAYEELVDLFGKPTVGDAYKVDAEWVVKFEDGTVATIHNWKDGKNYNGEAGTPTEQIKSWSIGGYDSKAAVMVTILVDLYREKKAEQEKSKKKRDDLDDALESAFDIMETLRSTKGLAYAHAVETAMLVHKILDLQHILLLQLVETETLEPRIAKDLTKITSLITSKIIGLAARTAKNGDDMTKEEAKELMAWADRIIKCETEGAAAILKDFFKDKDE